jgi:hypothetical protein
MPTWPRVDDPLEIVIDPNARRQRPLRKDDLERRIRKLEDQYLEEAEDYEPPPPARRPGTPGDETDESDRRTAEHETGLSQRQVRRWVNKLVLRGMIVKEKRSDKRGRQTSNTVTFLWVELRVVVDNNPDSLRAVTRDKREVVMDDKGEVTDDHRTPNIEVHQKELQKHSPLLKHSSYQQSEKAKREELRAVVKEYVSPERQGRWGLEGGLRHFSVDPELLIGRDWAKVKRT